MNPEPQIPILEIVGAITPLILLILRWVDKHHEKKWKRDDVEHKYRMELVTAEARRAAVTAVDAVADSKRERHRQIGEIKDLIAGKRPVREPTDEPPAPRASVVPTSKPRPRPDAGLEPQPSA